ncbi:MAG TPA: hypothetical protein VFG14_05245, partial [Chthoniobacteraceae bacterium]|nr:hypothetical protein [Chthoniobacteraceae bacterium]
AGMAFDSCQNEAVISGIVALPEYPIVAWASGQESTADETFNSVEQAKVMEFRAAGGHLFVSGSEIAWDLDRVSGPTTADRAFFYAELKADLSSDANDNSSSYSLSSTAGGIFAARAGASFDNGTGGTYWVRTPDILTPVGQGVTAALNYTGASAGPAAIQYDGSAGGGKVVYFGFPFETITSGPRRSQYMTDILNFFTARSVLVAAGSAWKFRDTGEDLGVAWTELGFDDLAWPSGPAQLGFGEDDEATPLASVPSRITTYFRRIFNVADPRKYRALTLRLMRDDGAVVWLNGTELARSNMPLTGDIGWGTSASSGVSGTAENVFVNHELDARGLRVGINVLAVELHQFGDQSTDLSFDLELSASRDFPSLLVGSGSPWKYRDSGVPPPSDWAHPAYNDAAWPSGPARLGYGGDGEATVVGFGGNVENRHMTTWFRHSFTVTNPSVFDALKVEIQRDDGAIVYLNGVELLRDNLSSQTILPSTPATVAVGGTDELAWHAFIVPSNALRTGLNVVAVELHQSTTNSSDLGMDLRLLGVAQGSIDYSQWRAANFGSDAVTSLAAETGDPDFDSNINLAEYALGGDPSFGSESTLTGMDAASGRLSLLFSRNVLAIDVEYVVQGADDMTGPWLDLAHSVNGESLDPLVPGVTVIESMAGSLRQAEVRDLFQIGDPAHPQRFLRLRLLK